MLLGEWVDTGKTLGKGQVCGQERHYSHPIGAPWNPTVRKTENTQIHRKQEQVSGTAHACHSCASGHSLIISKPFKRPAVFISNCCEKWLHTYWLKTTHIHHYHSVEIRYLQGDGGTVFPWCLDSEDQLVPRHFLASRSCPQSVAFDLTSFQPLLPSWYLLPYLSHSFLLRTVALAKIINHICPR